MSEKSNFEGMSVFEQLRTGLGQSLAQARGELSLRTTALPLPPPPASARRVRALRRRLRMSQSVFAATLNISPKLVQAWEQGARKPDRGELRLIQIIEKDPGLIRELFAAPAARHKSLSTKTSKRASAAA